METTAGTGGGMELNSVLLHGPFLILPLGTRGRMSAAGRFVGMTACTFEISFSCGCGRTPATPRCHQMRVQTREKEETKQTNQTTKLDQKTAHSHPTSTLTGPSFVRTFHMATPWDSRTTRKRGAHFGACVAPQRSHSLAQHTTRASVPKHNLRSPFIQFRRRQRRCGRKACVGLHSLVLSIPLVHLCWERNHRRVTRDSTMLIIYASGS